MSINKNDRVLVIAGKDKGRTGTVLNVDRVSDRVIVAGVNIVKKTVKHQNPPRRTSQGTPFVSAKVKQILSEANFTFFLTFCTMAEPHGKAIWQSHILNTLNFI